VECEIAGCLAKVLTEARGCRFTQGSEGLPELQNHPKLAPSKFEENWSIYPPCSMGAPHFQALAQTPAEVLRHIGSPFAPDKDHDAPLSLAQAA
jgi:hypothetical protein